MTPAWRSRLCSPCCKGLSNVYQSVHLLFLVRDCFPTGCLVACRSDYLLDVVVDGLDITFVGNELHILADVSPVLVDAIPDSTLDLPSGCTEGLRREARWLLPVVQHSRVLGFQHGAHLSCIGVEPVVGLPLAYCRGLRRRCREWCCTAALNSSRRCLVFPRLRLVHW